MPGAYAGAPVPDARHRHSWQRDKWICRHGGKQAYHLDITRIHQLHQVFHNHVHAVFVKVAVVTETEQIQFQALALHHALARNIADYDFAEIGLRRDGAQRGKFRANKRNHIFTAGMTFSNVSSSDAS